MRERELFAYVPLKYCAISIKVKRLDGWESRKGEKSIMRFEPVAGWAKVPHGVWLKEATSVAVDAHDNVYVFNRGNFPMVVFSDDGEVIETWGTDNPWSPTLTQTDPYGNHSHVWNTWFKRPHAITVDSEGFLWLVDDTGNQIHKMTPEGRFVMTVGNGDPAPKQSGQMFNSPTDVAVHPKTGEIFISDGYGNSRVHRLDPSGRHILSWGKSGTDNGEFSLPHNIAITGDDEIVVCDRENHRVQMFSIEGEFIRKWHVHKPTAVFCAKDGNIYVGEQGPPPVQQGVPNLGNRVSIYTPDGELVARFGNSHFGEGTDQFLWPHGVGVNSKGEVYVAEVSFVEWGRLQKPIVDNPASLRKWTRTE